MHQLKNFALILGLLSSFVTINASAFGAEADKSIEVDEISPQKLGQTYRARITTPKAIVYADENMNSPLGFISNGKLITVGNPRRMNRELVPLVVYGRVAFIQIKDIRYEDDEGEQLTSKSGAPREHDIDIIITPPDEKLSENNSAYLTLQNFFPGSDLKDFFMAVDGEEKSSLLGVHMQFIHRREFSRVFWGAGFDYSMASSDHASFGYFMINPTVGFTFMRNPLFLVDIYGSIDFSVSTLTNVEGNSVNEPSGFVWGPQINSRIVFFPDRRYHLVGGLSYKKYKTRELSNLTDLNDNPIEGIVYLNGLSFSLGLGMEF